MQKYEDMPKLAQQYLFYLLTIKGRSERTVDAYAVDLRSFFRFIQLRHKTAFQKIPFDEIPIQELSLPDFQEITLLDGYEYLNDMMQNHGNSARARARKTSSLRGFFKYLSNNLRVLEENPFDNLEMPSLKKSLPKYLTLDQSKTLLVTSASKESPTHYRNYCILTLFLNCGMRLSELVGIHLSDFDLKAGTLKLLGKGNKERMVFLNPACKQAIDNYLTKERSELKQIRDKNTLFLSSRTGSALGARQVQNIVSQALKDAGLSQMGYSTHKLRHTAATLMYRYGQVDILVLKELLGHCNVGTTEIYTHVADESVKQAVTKNPLADQKIDSK